MMNKMAVEATLVSNALNKEQKTEVDDNIDVKEEYLTSEDSADRDFYQQIIKCESLSNDEEDGGSSDANGDNNVLDKEQKTEVDDNIDVRKEYLTSDESAHPGFYKVLIKCESLSDGGQDGCSSDATKDNNALDKDETNINTDTDSQEFPCLMCKEVFTDRLTFDAHLRNHINNITGLECLICNKKISKNSNLKKHMKSHLGMKDYDCTICKKKFVTRTKYCIVSDCKSSSEFHPDRGFFCLPANEEILKKWAENMKIADPATVSHKFVCGLHFEDKCFRTADKQKLNRGVIPTILNSTTEIGLSTAVTTVEHRTEPSENLSNESAEQLPTPSTSRSRKKSKLLTSGGRIKKLRV